MIRLRRYLLGVDVRALSGALALVVFVMLLVSSPRVSGIVLAEGEAEGSGTTDRAVGAPSDGQAVGEVVVIRIASPIHRVAEEFLLEAIEDADAAGAEALVIELETPGGALNSTRKMTSAILESRTPVVIFISPAGAQAASAGFILLMSADVAAMAPGSNTGAAHPVGGQGEDIEGSMGEKVEQDTAAYVRSLAERNGRDLALAEAAVLESRSWTASEALENGLVDFVSPNLQSLLQDIDGQTVTRDDEVLTLETARASIRRRELSPFQRAIGVLADPNIAYLLLGIGWIGIYAEISNPGSIFPGAVGVLCLLLGFYALSVLPTNWAAVGLIGLAVILFVLEIKVQSFGMLTVGGLVSMVLGSLLLFRSADPALQVSRGLIAAVTLISLILVVFLGRLAFGAFRRRVVTGEEGLVGKRGEARTDIAPRGKVMVHGELWNVISDAPITAGQMVEVIAVDGLMLRVRAVGVESTAC